MSINDLFFRPFDKARLDRLTEAIVQEKLSAALVSESEGLLDHYGRILVQRLRERTEINVEVYYPNSTEALITRFNKILENISVDAATRKNNSNAPQRALVAFDSQSTGLREIQLMARLVRDFPGANTRIILLLDKKSSTQVEKKIEAFGNKIVRWDIATPTQREASVLLSQSELTGMEPEVRQALENVGVSLDAKLALAASNRAINRAEEAIRKEDPTTKIDDSSVKNNDVINNELTDNKESLSVQKTEYSVNEPVVQDNTENKENKTIKRKNQFNAFLALSFLIALSVGVISYLHNSGLLPINSMLEDMRKVFLQSDLNEITNADGLTPKDDRILEKQDDQFSLLSPPSYESEMKEEEAIFEFSKSDKDEEPSEKENTVTPVKKDFKDKSERDSTTEKVRQSIEPGFYVQHTARGDLESVLNIQTLYPSLSNSIILKLRKTQVDGFFFVLLTGPFNSLDEAKSFTTRDDIPTGTWIRGALSIRPLIISPE